MILGEGDATVTELVGALKAGTSLTSVAGVAVLDATRQRSANRITPVHARARRSPAPAWDLVDVERYRRIWRRRHGYYAMNLATTRGCPFHCNWCAKPIYGQRYAVRSAADVVDEIAWLEARLPARPARDRRRRVRSAARVGRDLRPSASGGGVGLPFRCLMRADQIDRRHGAGAGRRRLPDGVDGRRIGIAAHPRRDGEGHARRADHAGGSTSAERRHRGRPVPPVRLSRRRVGRRGGDAGARARTWRPTTSACRCRIRCRAPSSTSGCARSWVPKQNWFDSDDLAMMYRATYEPEFYRVLHRVVHHEFRAHASRARLGTVVGGARMRRPGRSAAAAAWIYHRASLPVAERQLCALARRPQSTPAPARLVPLLTRGAAVAAIAAVRGHAES